jgi:hypothetical protein
MDVLWQTGFWYALGWFGVAQPVMVGIIFRVLVINYFDDGWTTDDFRQYVDALLEFSGYTITLLLLRMVYISFASTRHLLGLVWRYPLWTCTICALILGLSFLIHMQRMKLTSLRTKFYESLLSFLLVGSSIYLRGGRLPTKLGELAKRSSYIRIGKLCLKRWTIWILGNPTFDSLEEFRYPSLPTNQK